MTKLTITQSLPVRAFGLLFAAFLLLVATTSHAVPNEPRFMKVRVTFYSPTSRGKTATGRSARLPGVAVDPRVIPLGSRVAVPGFGVRVADDTGSAIKGRRIDVRLPVGKRALAYKHGVKHLRVRIVTPSQHGVKHKSKHHAKVSKRNLARKHRTNTPLHKKTAKRMTYRTRHSR